MSQIEFAKWYYQVGQDAAELMAEFYGVALREVAAWEAGLKNRVYDTYASAAAKLEVHHG